MIQDIFPYHLDNHYDAGAVVRDDSLVVVFSDVGDGKKLLLKIDDENKEISYPCYDDLKEVIEKEQLIYLFNIDSESFFLLNADIENKKETDLKISGYSFCNMRDLRKEYLYPKQYVFAGYTAFQLAEWYQVTKFCGRCGGKNVNDKTERARVCPECGNRIYPRINPAVIVGVTDKSANKMILTRYRTGFAHNALVAGFTEIGETLEETVEREVYEEVGLKVTNIRYYKSQPWGVASDILAGFFCDVEGKADIQMDTSELKYAEWVSPDDIELQPLEYSLTNEMMKLFKEKGYSGTVK